MSGRPSWPTSRDDRCPRASPDVTGESPEARASQRATELADRLRAHLEATEVPAPGSRVVVAVSGGLDSTALLHLLRFPLRDLALRLTVAHVDHAMRPGSADDALWVRGLCGAWSIPVRAHRLDPPARSEADARDRRYAFLQEVARSLGETEPAWIATGHHRDDQAETVLFRVIRGTGLRGLRGIAPRRGRLIRPLLPFRRDDLEAYARAVGLRWRTDPTNRDPAYARNRIRHHVLPALESARPGVAESLARLADLARGAEAEWRAALERLEGEVVLRSDEAGLALARPVLHSYHPGLRARLLRRLLRRWGTSPDRAGTDAALEFISSGSSGRGLDLPGGVRIERDFDEIRIRRATPDGPPDQAVRIPGVEPGSGRARIGGREMEVVWGRGPVRAGSRHVTLRDPVFPLILRGWAPGDRIRFDYGSKKLKALFREKRLDRHERRAAPVLVDGAGRVVWVADVARAEGVGEDDVGFHIAVMDAG